MTNIVELANVGELDAILSKSKDKLSVIDFHAVWCGPCKTISPVFARLASNKTYSDVNFLKCDVDAASDIAKRYDIRAMPTFIFLKGSSEVGRLKGARPDQLQSELDGHHTGTSGGAFSGKGQRLGSGETVASERAPAAGGLNWGPLENLSPQTRVFALLFAVYMILFLFKKS